MATPTLYQHVSHSNVQGNTVTTYQMRLPNPSLSGNCIIVGINRSAAGVAPTITDDKGNTYTSLGSSSDGNQVVHLFAALNVTAGAQNLTVTFGTATNFVSGMASEFFNVATASAKDTVSAGVNPTTGTGSSTSIATAAFTPSTSGDLLYQFGIQDTTSSPITSFTQGSSPWKLLSADIFDSTFAQYQVQAAAASITPTATMSPTNAWNTICVALKSASAGTAPTGMYIQRCQHNAIPAGSGSPVHTQFPCSGNLLVMSTIMEPSLTITAVADGNSNTYANTGTAFSLSTSGNVRHFYVVNPTTTSTMTGPTFTFTGSPISGSTVVAFDIVGASTTSPYDSTAGRSTASGTQASAGSFSGAALAPSRSGGIIFSTLGVESNTIIAVSGGGFIFLASSDNPEVSPWPNDQNNGWADVPNAPASSATPSWTSTGGGAGNWANVTDAFLPPASLTVVVDDTDIQEQRFLATTRMESQFQHELQDTFAIPPQRPPFAYEDDGANMRWSDWRALQYEDTETHRALPPIPPVSIQEEFSEPLFVDWRARQFEDTDTHRALPPTPPFSIQDEHQDEKNFNWSAIQYEDAETQRALPPTPPPAIQDEISERGLQGAVPFFEEEQPGKPIVVAAAPNIGLDDIEAHIKSFDRANLYHEDDLSTVAPTPPLSIQDDEQHTWRAWLAPAVEDDARWLAPLPPFVAPDDAAEKWTATSALAVEDDQAALPPIPPLPTFSIQDDEQHSWRGWLTPHLEADWTAAAPVPPLAFEDDLKAVSFNPIFFPLAETDLVGIPPVPSLFGDDEQSLQRYAVAGLSGLILLDDFVNAPVANGPFTIASLSASVRPGIDSLGAAVRASIDSRGAVIRSGVDSLGGTVRPS